MFELLSSGGVVAAALIAPPGIDVITALAAIDPTSLSDYSQVDYLIGWERQTAWIAAQTQPALCAVGATVENAACRAKIGADSLDMPLRAAFTEIGAAVRMGDHQAANRLLIARALAGPLALVQATLTLGDISLAHAHVIWETTQHLTDEQQAWIAAEVLPRARHQTVAQLRRCCNRAVIRVEPLTAADRAKKAHTERRLDWDPLPDGMAELHLIAAATDIMAAYAAADTLAKHLRLTQTAAPGTDGWHSLAALRSDALIALATGTATGNTGNTGNTGTGAAASGAAGKPVIHVTIDFPTLVGLQDNPAELAGYGPLPAPLARLLAADGTWRRLIYEPFTGALLDLGQTRYTPSDPLARYLIARDVICAFPTCNRRAADCDLDHTNPYRDDGTGGPTDRNNLGALCPRHHRVKHETNWHLHRDTTTEHATWTSPTGHQYRVDHHDYRNPGASDLPDDPQADIVPSYIPAAWVEDLLAELLADLVDPRFPDTWPHHCQDDPTPATPQPTPCPF